MKLDAGAQKAYIERERGEYWELPEEFLEELNVKHVLFYDYRHDLDKIKGVFAKIGMEVSELNTLEGIADWKARWVGSLLAYSERVDK